MRTQGGGAYLHVIHRSVRNFQIPPSLPQLGSIATPLWAAQGGWEVGGGGMMMFAHELTGVYTFFK